MPGECLERGTQDVYILGEDEGLILKCNEAFTDTDEDEVCTPEILRIARHFMVRIRYHETMAPSRGWKNTLSKR